MSAYLNGRYFILLLYEETIFLYHGEKVLHMFAPRYLHPVVASFKANETLLISPSNV